MKAIDRTAAYQTLANQAPNGYTLSSISVIEIPFQQLRLPVQLTQAPPSQVDQLYRITLEAIALGHNTDQALGQVLGLSENDFFWQEIYRLRGMGLLNRQSDNWMLTQQGERFLHNKEALWEHALEDRQVFVHHYLPYAQWSKPQEVKEASFRLPPRTTYGDQDSRWLPLSLQEDLRHQYEPKKDRPERVLTLDPKGVSFGRTLKTGWLLCEYWPKENSTRKEPLVELREPIKPYKLHNQLTEWVKRDYPMLQDLAKLPSIELDPPEEITSPQPIDRKVFKRLSVEETARTFERGIVEAKRNILIESPWIKAATLPLIPSFEKALENGVDIFILYGLPEHGRTKSRSSHDEKSLEQLIKLKKRTDLTGSLTLIHLPDHLQQKGIPKVLGTHRKLFICDNTFYQEGSYNYLSFRYRSGQEHSNEGSHIFYQGVEERWNDIMEEYRLD